MGDVKWIKIVTDIFDDEKILLIESLPEADSLIVIWFKLLCLAGKQNNGGVFMINDRIHYTDEMFATIFRRNLNTVRLALDTFEKFGMIERFEGTVTIPNWGKHQCIEQMEARREYQRKYHAEYRKKQKLLASGEMMEQGEQDDDGQDLRKRLRDDLRTQNVNGLDKEEDKDKNKKKNKEKEIYKEKESLLRGKRAPFTPPTLDEVQQYAMEKGYSQGEFDPESFVAFYGSKNWKVGRDKMTDWKCAVRGWVARYRKEHRQEDSYTASYYRQPTPEELEAIAERDSDRYWAEKKGKEV